MRQRETERRKERKIDKDTERDLCSTLGSHVPMILSLHTLNVRHKDNAGIQRRSAKERES